MKFRFIVAIFLITLMSACKVYQPKVYPSNAQVIDESIKEASAQAVRKLQVYNIDNGKPLAERTKVALVNIDNVFEVDEPPNSSLSDHFMEEVTKGGFLVSEKDDDVLLRALHESNSTLRYALTTGQSKAQPFDYSARIEARRPEDKTNDVVPVYPSHPIEDEFKLKEIYTARQGGADSVTVVAQGNSGSIGISNINSSKDGSLYGELPQREEPKVFNDYPTADYVLAYRLVEAGVRYAAAVDERGRDKTRKQVRRIADAKLHVRLLDSKTGLVQWADYAEGRTVDDIPRKLVSVLKSNPYGYDGEGYPSIRRQADEERFAVRAKRVPTAGPETYHQEDVDRREGLGVRLSLGYIDEVNDFALAGLTWKKNINRYFSTEVALESNFAKTEELFVPLLATLKYFWDPRLYFGLGLGGVYAKADLDKTIGGQTVTVSESQTSSAAHIQGGYESIAGVEYNARVIIPIDNDIMDYAITVSVGYTFE